MLNPASGDLAELPGGLYHVDFPSFIPAGKSVQVNLRAPTSYAAGSGKGGASGFTAENLMRYGACYSACVYAFAGGVARAFDANGGILGIHQFSSTDEKPPRDGQSPCPLGRT
jgi:hypothetical protein